MDEGVQLLVYCGWHGVNPVNNRCAISEAWRICIFAIKSSRAGEVKVK